MQVCSWVDYSNSNCTMPLTTELTLYKLSWNNLGASNLNVLNAAEQSTKGQSQRTRWYLDKQDLNNLNVPSYK